MRKKIRTIIIAVCAAVMFLAGAALIFVANFALGVKPVNKSFNENISFLSAYQGGIIAGTAQGDLFLIDGQSQEEKSIGSFGSRVIFAQPFKENFFVAAENRTVYIVSPEGEVLHLKAVAYNPITARVSEDYISMIGSTSVTRNRVYLFDGTLALQNIIPNAVNAPQGDSESDMLFQERTNCMSLDFPLLDLYHMGGSKFIIVSASSYIYAYDGGEVVSRVMTEHAPVCADFGGEAIFIADLSGGYKQFDYDLKLIKTVAMKDNAQILFYSQGNIFLTSNTRVYCFDGEGKRLYSFKTAAPSMYAAFGGDITALGFSERADYLVYNSHKLKIINTVEILLIIAYFLAPIFGIWFAVMCATLFKPGLSKSIGKKTKTALKAAYKSKWCLIAIAPAILLAAVFAYYPAINSFRLAFYNVQPGGVNIFVGFRNFSELMGKQFFWNGITNMLILLGTDIVKALIPAFIFAELIIAMRSGRAQYLTRVIMFLPGILPGVAAMLIWKDGIFGINGLVNGVFAVFRSGPVNFLGDSRYALGTLVLFGFPWIGSYIILYGALKGVPSSYYEAAKLDGCSWLKRLFFIDIPMISPQLKYIFVLTFIGSAQDFQRVFLTTEGAFGTYVPMLELYYNLTLFNNYGMAAAMGLILFAVMMVATILNLKIKTVEGID